MKALVIYESMFGNTEHVARKIAEGLEREGCQTVVADVRTVRPPGVTASDLLVVGAPTHAFSLSRRSTRDDAVQQGADPARAEVGVREWLTTLDTSLPTGARRPLVATFDTRVPKVRRLPGSAARRAARSLRNQGFELLDHATSFYVGDVKGPVVAGELDRAREWGAGLVRRARDHDQRNAS